MSLKTATSETEARVLKSPMASATAGLKYAQASATMSQQNFLDKYSTKTKNKIVVTTCG